MKTTHAVVGILLSLSSVSALAASDTLKTSQAAPDSSSVKSIGVTPASQATAPSVAAKPKLSLLLRTAYYEMQGKRWAHNDLFGFNDASVNMQILTASYVVNPTLSVTATTSYNRTYLETIVPGLAPLIDEPKGMGDTKLLARYTALADSGHVVALEGGLSLPTGTINAPNARSTTGAHLAYNLQLGSGTVDPVLATSYSYTAGAFTHGARAQGTFRFADNKNSYRFGHEYVGSLWSDYRLIGNALVPSLRFNAKQKRAIQGWDPTIKHSAYNEFYLSPQTSWDLTLAAKSTLPIGIAGANLLIEAGLPLLQNTINAAGYHIDTQFFGVASIQVAM